MNDRIAERFPVAPCSVAVMKIADVVDAPDLDYEVEVDDHVPLAFRMVWLFAGMPRYVRFYPDDDAPLELTLVEEVPLVRSVVLLNIKRTGHVATVDVSKKTFGAPVLDVQYPLPHDPDEAFFLDLPVRYVTALGDDFLELRVGPLEKADEAIVCGPMTYFAYSRELVGMRLDGLSREQVETLRWHASRHDHPSDNR